MLQEFVFFVPVFFVFCILFYGVYDNKSLLSVRWSVHPYFRPFGMDGMGWDGMVENELSGVGW